MWDFFDKFVEWYAAYGYLVLFFGVFVEGAGVPVPGETAVLVAGFLASSAGGASFPLPYVMAVAFVAAVLGDNLGYQVGQRLARPHLQRDRGFLFLTPSRMRLVESYFERYGIWTVFFARFITGLRVVCAVSAGAAGMRWLRFFLANASGCLVWAIAMSLIGYFFGKSWHALHPYMNRAVLIIVACVVVGVIIWRWRRRRNNPVP
jgi:membrane protein DedA with SNARE-associated domain